MNLRTIIEEFLCQVARSCKLKARWKRGKSASWGNLILKAWQSEL